MNNYNPDNITSSVLLCPRPQNPQAGNQKGSLDVPEDVLVHYPSMGNIELGL